MNRFLLAAGAFLGALAVALGAFGAHALGPVLQETGYTATFETGNKYHFYHSIAIILSGILQHYFNAGLSKAAGYLFIAGIVLFSFSLYALSLTGIRSLGIITPFGGLSFIAGWFLLMAAVLKKSPDAVK